MFANQIIYGYEHTHTQTAFGRFTLNKNNCISYHRIILECIITQVTLYTCTDKQTKKERK